MKTVRDFISNRRSGFTLAELAVAMAVLSIVAVGLLQLLNFSMQTWQQGLVRTNCFIKARTVLDMAVADIQRGVFRADLHNFPNPTSYSTAQFITQGFTFYTRAAGISSGTAPVRPISLVTYQLSTASSQQGYLLRSENTINWSGANSNVNFLQQLSPIAAASAGAGAAPPDDLLCKGVVGFEMLFLLADGHTIPAKYYQSPTAPTAPVVMIGVAVAVIDDQTMTQLQAAAPAAFGNIQTALATAVTSNFSQMTIPTGFTTYVSTNTARSIKGPWDVAMVPFYQGAGYPKALAVSFQTFERFVPCTAFN